MYAANWFVYTCLRMFVHWHLSSSGYIWLPRVGFVSVRLPISLLAWMCECLALVRPAPYPALSHVSSFCACLMMVIVHLRLLTLLGPCMIVSWIVIVCFRCLRLSYLASVALAFFIHPSGVFPLPLSHHGVLSSGHATLLLWRWLRVSTLSQSVVCFMFFDDEFDFGALSSWASPLKNISQIMR